MDLFRHHKERASAYLAKGKRKHALKEYRLALEANPGDVQVRQKLADLLLQLGHKEAAIREYQSVAGKYAADGFLVKAMAICKVILRIDPGHTETQEVLAELFATQNPNAILPPSMTGALVGSTLRVTPARPMGTRATRSAMPAVKLDDDGPELEHERPAAPSPRGAFRLDELEAVLVPGAAEATGGQPSAAPVDEPAAQESVAPSSLRATGKQSASSIRGGVPSLASSARPAADDDAALRRPPLPAGLVPPPGQGEAPLARDDDPDTLVAQLFTDDLASSRPSAPSYDDPSLYLDPGDEEEVSGDVDLVGHSTNVDTAEVAVDLSNLAPIPLFSQLDKEGFMAVFERLEVKSVAAGVRLITEGQTTRTMYILAQGEVRVFREVSGAEVELARLGDGSFFGEIALLSSSPRMASVETTEQSILFEMTREDVAEIVKRHPSVTSVLASFYRERFLANLVRSNPILFSPLGDDEKRAVFQHFQSVTVPPGTVLLQKGEMGQGLYLILRGECDVVDAAPDGREFTLPVLREGDFFGEVSLLLNTTVSATVRARTTCVVLRLPREIFYEKVMRHPAVRRHLTDVTNERLRIVADMMAAAYAPDDPVLV